MNKPIDISSLPGDFIHLTLDKLYKLDRVLTEDYTGTIYSTKTKIRGHEVAVNVLAPKCVVVSRKLIRIDHPNICKAHKVLTLKDGTVVVVIDKPEGKPILDFMNDPSESVGGTFHPGRVISAVMQLLSALHAVHQVGKTARNLNVNNVFVNRDRNGNMRLKLVSVGIDGPGVNLKAPHYFSPERVMQIDKGDPRADIWAAGAVFYHLCFGHPPFGGKNVEVAKKNLLDTPSFEAGDKKIPDTLIDIIRQALDRDENKRYQTVSEMIGDLLPLQAAYNEPMSDDVSTALRKSYPPPPPGKGNGGKIIPKKPQPLGKGGLRPLVGESSSSDKSETTAEYGKDEKKAPKKTLTIGRFLGVDFSPSAQQSGAKNDTAKKKRPDVSRTLMGIPAIRLDEDPKTPDKKLPSKPERSTKSDDRESLLSARSLLGSDEDIKKLEEELDFLEERKDEDIPTLVLGEANFAALTGNAGITAPKETARSSAVATPATKSRTEAIRDIAVKSKSERQEQQQLKSQQHSQPKSQLQQHSQPKSQLQQHSQPKSQPQQHSQPKSQPQQQPPASTPAQEIPIETASGNADDSVSMTPLTLDDLQAVSVPADIDKTRFLREALATALATTEKQLRRLAENKPLLLGVIAAVIAGVVLTIVMVKTRDGASLHGTMEVKASAPITASPSAEPKAPAASESTPSQPSAPAPRDTAPAAVPSATNTEVEAAATEITPPKDQPTASAVNETPPAPSTVTIRFLDIPDDSDVKVNGEPVTLPFVTTKSKELLTVHINAEGFEPFRVRVVPDRDRDVPVRLHPKKKPEPKKSKKRTEKKRKKHTGNLVSNPFKK